MRCDALVAVSWLWNRFLFLHQKAPLWKLYEKIVKGIFHCKILTLRCLELKNFFPASVPTWTGDSKNASHSLLLEANEVHTWKHQNYLKMSIQNSSSFGGVEVPVIPGFHCVHVCFGTAPLRVCSVPTGCVQVAFQSAAQLDSWSCETARFHGNYRITCERGLWKRLICWLHVKLNKMWSGANMEYFNLRLAVCFNVVSVSDFLSHFICSVLNRCIVLCQKSGKNRSLMYHCGRLRISGAATE